MGIGIARSAKRTSARDAPSAKTQMDARIQEMTTARPNAQMARSGSPATLRNPKRQPARSARGAGIGGITEISGIAAGLHQCKAMP